MQRGNVKIREFQVLVLKYFRKNGRRSLLWRKTRDPYRILVSEIMLQQTQVSRAEGKYKEFLKAFPTVRVLAKAPLADVLKVWSGLGYNRRAKYLHDAAKVIVGEYRGDFRRALTHPLPGVGPYTLAAVRTFAFNEPHTMLETNIRAVFIHHFYSSVLQKTAIRDAELVPLIEQAAAGQEPREWHWALMDYGAHLKRSGVRNNHRSVHYSKQTRFEGSLRQVRGGILRALHDSPKSERQLKKILRSDLKKLRAGLAGLAKDGLMVKQKGKWQIA